MNSILLSEADECCAGLSLAQPLTRPNGTFTIIRIVSLSQPSPFLRHAGILF